mmetsp:Transcript_6377/g.19344  ORF Transcript_6377/g.19344 Transcript_6377/m.19344 type:complete len:236 (-) Transcript_6377:521-1228(-)
MEWWLGDEWRHSTLDQQERHLRSATQWANQRVKRTRHRLVDDELLQSRLGCLLQMTSTGCVAGPGSAMPPPRHHVGPGPLAVPQFRGSARDWAAQLGISSGARPPVATYPVEAQHTHSLSCGHTPVKVISTEGTTSLGFVMSRASCCTMSGNLLCEAHAGQQGKGAAPPAPAVAAGPVREYSTVSHGDHIDFVIDGHLTHPTTERTDDGELKWEDCGELIELDQETIADMYNLLV